MEYVETRFFLAMYIDPCQKQMHHPTDIIFQILIAIQTTSQNKTSRY